MTLREVFAIPEVRDFLESFAGASLLIGFLAGAVFAVGLSLGADFIVWVRRLVRARRVRKAVDA